MKLNSYEAKLTGSGTKLNPDEELLLLQAIKGLHYDLLGPWVFLQFTFNNYFRR